LKILLLNYTDSGGGAAIAVARLFFSLRKNGIDVDFGVINKKLSNTIPFKSINKRCVFNSSKVVHFLQRISNKVIVHSKRMLGFEFKTSNPIFHSENKKTLIDINLINNSDYDLIHFHWINGDMISIEDISKIKKPIVWTMHDSWVFCGAEHHPNILEHDDRFITGYTRLNKPATTKGPDVCRRTWLRKKKAWKDCRFNFIAPSRFEEEILKKSALFHNTSFSTVIPNLVPGFFRPLNKNHKDIFKKTYCIPSWKKIIGFGSASNDKNKGTPFLLDSLQKIKNIDELYLVIFGPLNDSFAHQIKIPSFITGYIDNPYILASIYNICDVFVCPSLLENLPNVCLESLFCGVPVVAFRTGGIPDIVEHKKTGYLAEPFDTDDLYRGILYCIDNYNTLSQNSIVKARTDFDHETIIKRHIELYERILKNEP
jgi:glycosyltransferase involved in cell wall biosynthesis